MIVEFDRSFPRELRDDYMAVARSVTEVLRADIPGVPPLGERAIVCSHCKGSGSVPYVEWPVPSSEYYRIWLAQIGSKDYCRLAYQLSHEMAHVLMDPSRSNGAIEMLAVSVSYHTLDTLSEHWESSPPHASWKDFAPNFWKYRIREVAENLSEFPAPVGRAVLHSGWERVACYLRERRCDLDRDPCIRPLNSLGALYLLQAGIPWPELRGIAGKAWVDGDVNGEFQGNAKFHPDDIPDWLAPVWARA